MSDKAFGDGTKTIQHVIAWEIEKWTCVKTTELNLLENLRSKYMYAFG